MVEMNASKCKAAELMEQLKVQEDVALKDEENLEPRIEEPLKAVHFF